VNLEWKFDDFYERMIDRLEVTLPFIKRIVEFVDFWCNPTYDDGIIGFLFYRLICSLILIASIPFAGLAAGCRITFKAVIHQLKLGHAIARAPGTRLLALVDFVCSPKTVEQTFRPLVADWRYEYFEALKQNRKWKAR
jgi:hypothetical protein